MVCASTNQNFAMGSTTVPTLLMNSFAILNVMLIKNLNAIAHLTAFLRNGNAMEKETALMEVTKKIAQNQFVQKANFLAKILTAAALEQPVLILNGFVMARMIVVTGRMKPQTSVYPVHVNRIGIDVIIHVASYGVRFATRFQIVQMDQTNLLVHAQPQRDPVLSWRTFVATMANASMRSLFATPLTTVATVPTNMIAPTKNLVTSEPVHKVARLKFTLLTTILR